MLGWGLESLVLDHLAVFGVAAGLGVLWSAANAGILTEGRRGLIDKRTRFDGVEVIGVEEHLWRHTRHGEKYVRVIIDLTAVRARTGPARLLDMNEARSKEVFKSWLEGRPKS